jgi:UDP-N-acetylmuramyl pentapeptide synthase
MAFLKEHSIRENSLVLIKGSRGIALEKIVSEHLIA